MRPLTFWTLVTGAIFAAMTVLFTFGDEQRGAVYVVASVMYWASGVGLILAGLLAIGRFGRGPKASATRRDDDA